MFSRFILFMLLCLSMFRPPTFFHLALAVITKHFKLPIFFFVFFSFFKNFCLIICVIRLPPLPFFVFVLAVIFPFLFSAFLAVLSGILKVSKCFNYTTPCTLPFIHTIPYICWYVFRTQLPPTAPQKQNNKATYITLQNSKYCIRVVLCSKIDDIVCSQRIISSIQNHTPILPKSHIDFTKIILRLYQNQTPILFRSKIILRLYQNHTPTLPKSNPDFA